ncbi:hypothetical protein YM3MPS_19760 [Mycobacterium pseudoshottsii]|uniref:Uncharacterized protein n=1 Tax=Mycobacterium pseudoshottsii TaxID=265949 RepID=A0A9N7QK88_9MYCO|nr:hypothetical protein NJB1907Z4_C19880 [Mycobacterium pseudoshottsii]BEH76173.1 hypothetical protein YM3MPS_19760 [Mycobacterium pseudoshottsii]
MTERKRNLRPVREVTAPSLQFRTIHGYKRAFRIAGSGPAILLIHGIGDNSTTWTGIHAKLAQRFTVIAPICWGTEGPTSRAPTTRSRPMPTACATCSACSTSSA